MTDTSLLREFFGGYFNQDWAEDGAASWDDVVRRFMNENLDAHILAVRDALREFVRSNDDRTVAMALPGELGCDYNPRPDGLGAREWMGAIAELITRERDPKDRV